MTSAAADDPLAADAAALTASGVGTDAAALLDYFRRQAAAAADPGAIDRLVADLGGPGFRGRQRAAAELVRRGPAALPALRAARNVADPEVARRARDCVEQIEAGQSGAVPAAAARLLAARRPPGAAAALLAFLPLADDTAADDLRDALGTLAAADPADPAFRAALADSHPERRGAAAAALARGGPDGRALARPVLADPIPTARLRAAAGLAAAGDRAAVPVLIDLLGELPADAAWPAEDVLQRLAGDDAPEVPLARDAAGRAKCRDAWRAWWAGHEATADFARLADVPASRGVTFVVESGSRGPGSVVELGRDRTVRRRLDGLNLPVAAEPLPHDRVLVAEYSGGRVAELDFAGTVHWSRPVAQPIACQRLPGGRTFIATRTRVFEVDRRGEEVWSANQPPLAAATRGRDGRTVVVTLATGNQASRCVTLDARGQEVKAFTAGRCMSLATIDLLPRGHVLIPEFQDDRVAEYDADGKAVWRAGCEKPVAASRLPDGHTLVASYLGGKVVELNRSGAVVWEYRPTDGSRPWRALRK